MEDEKMIQLRIEQEIQKRLKDPYVIIDAYQNALTIAKKSIENLQPKAEVLDIMMGSENLIEMSAVAKIVNFRGMGRNNLFAYLVQKGILRVNREPYQIYVDKQYFKTVPQTFEINGTTQINQKTMTTMKGIDFIIKMLLEDGYAVNN